MINRFKRIFYVLYYLKNEDASKRKKFMKHVCDAQGISKMTLWTRMVKDSIRYNVSLNEYFLFHFYEIDEAEKKHWVGTGTIYEYQKKMNPPAHRKVLSNKVLFYNAYRPYIKHTMITIDELEGDSARATPIVKNPSGKVVLKPSDGQCGRGIEVLQTDGLTPRLLMQRMRDGGNDLAEEFVEQHDQLNRLSSSGLNTVRIITQLEGNGAGANANVNANVNANINANVNANINVRLLGARLRITVNSPVDNLAAGNIAVPIDLETGIVCGPGVYSDITKQDETHHPVTGIKLEGFQVPFWRECVELAVQAALHDTQNRSIGWDIAVTNEGPELIEGNHDWCKLLWQLPVKKGLQAELESDH